MCSACEATSGHSLEIQMDTENLRGKKNRLEIFDVYLSLYKLSDFCILGVMSRRPPVLHMSLVVRKPVFGVSDQVRYKSGCTATEDGQRLEISDLGSRGIVLSV